MLYDFASGFAGTFRCEAEDDKTAEAAANKYFEGELEKYNLPLPSGRWVISDEGEDGEGNVSYISYNYETPLHIAYFCADRRYPEDNKIVGVFSSKENAEAAITKSIANDKKYYPDHPRRDQQKSYRYSIDEFYLDEIE